MTMLCYDTGTKPAALNMAIDEVLLKKRKPVLRLYRWSRTAITLGRYQACKEVCLKQTEKNGIPVIRRETGGKAVLHGDDLTISLMLHKNKKHVSVKKAVIQIGEGIVRGLRFAGINAEQVEGGNKYHTSSYCFSLHSPYEVVVGMKKIAGIAGRIYSEKVLYQVSIPLNVNRDDIKKYFVLSKNEGQKLTEMIGLKEALSTHFQLHAVKKALITGIAESLDKKVRYTALTEKEIEEAKNLALSKYNQDKWNLQR